MLYGLAECARGKIFANHIQNQEVDEIGKLMSLSHNGDRICTFSDDGTKSDYHSPISNSYLLDLIDDLESGEPERVIKAQLQYQPGSYRCSIAEIDFLVDMSLRVEGVVGAQLAGAGLGGCMMVLVRKSRVGALSRTLRQKYFRMFNKRLTVLQCEPVAGSGVLLR